MQWGVEARGDFIVVGDMMKSVSLHVFNPATNQSACNLFAVRKHADAATDEERQRLEHADAATDEERQRLEHADAATDEERQRLEVCAEFHLGEFVNRIQRGSLTMQLTGNATHTHF
ncbi:hypothetical protein T492DRAFT_913487 [Pavlovales sp. CCMP2436]|nr:hypothetical protein T492DRAFT_913487 [Pavlovales sp. CCMP2436]